MIPAREFFDAGLVYIATMGLLSALVIAWTLPRAYQLRATNDAGILLGVSLICGLSAYLVTGQLAGTLSVAVIALTASLALRYRLRRLSMPGALLMALPPLHLSITGPWTYLLLKELAFPQWMLLLSLVATIISAVILGFACAGALAKHALLTHRVWRRPTRPHAELTVRDLPKVSIHLPCYAEPPELVIATLNSLARLDYPDFEVLVCDNNTKDEALWWPVAAHCARLNRALGSQRFRFFHVAPLAGAKAGALNYLLDRMAPDATLVAVVDADYIAKPDFLSRLVGFFDDPAIGYIQTPHDYRGFEESTYLRACYWEYMPSNKIDMAAISQYDAAFTIGTMCLIRTSALNEAGRWAEWCLTEDSEVSIRLRAVGYDGLYFRDTFGRGLIPETFDDYKKQRFRWTAGPVQQLCRHWRLYLPRPFCEPSSMGGWSKLLEFQRSAAPVLTVAGTVFAFVAGSVMALLTAANIVPRLIVPDVAWVAMGLTMAAMLVRKWHRYRLSGCERIRDMLAGEFAAISLTYVKMVGAVAGLSAKPLEWRRTPKFKAEGAGLRALQATLPETLLGLAHAPLFYLTLSLSPELGWHFVLLATLGCLASAMRFLSAPIMSLLSERHLRATADMEHQHGETNFEEPIAARV